MNQSLKIIFFGNERLSSDFRFEDPPTLKALLNSGHTVVAIVANYHETTSRKKRQLEVKQFAEQNHIPIYLPGSLKEIHPDLKNLKPDIGVLVAYGKIVPQEIIDIFPHGIINIHPSLLPLYRGSTPIEQAILDGAKSTGVSLMSLVKAMDAGPLFAQQKVELTGNESKQELTARLLKLGGEMLLKNMSAIVDGSLKPTNQDDSNATYCKLLAKSDGNIDLNKTASTLEKEIRAYSGWPKSHLEIFGQPIVINQAKVVANLSDGDLVISCANNTFLEITQLTGPSGRTMNGAEFLRGYKK